MQAARQPLWQAATPCVTHACSQQPTWPVPMCLLLRHQHACMLMLFRLLCCLPSSAQAKAIQRLMVALCSELRGVALGLVSAFGVPDHILRAPIGLAAYTGVDMYKEYLMAVGFDV